MRSSSYLWGCDRALTALPGQLRPRGDTRGEPPRQGGGFPGKTKEKEWGKARSGCSCTKAEASGLRTAPCPANTEPARKEQHQPGACAAPGRPRRLSPRPRLSAPAPARATYWSPGQSGSPREESRDPPPPAALPSRPGRARPFPVPPAAPSEETSPPPAATERGDTAEASAPPCACAAAPPAGRAGPGAAAPSGICSAAGEAPAGRSAEPQCMTGVVVRAVACLELTGEKVTPQPLHQYMSHGFHIEFNAEGAVKRN